MNNKNVSQQNRTSFALRFIYTIQLKVMLLWKELHPVCLPIAPFLFSNYNKLFYNVYYLQYLLLENNITTDDAQKKITVYTFQLNSFEHKNVTLF